MGTAAQAAEKQASREDVAALQEQLAAAQEAVRAAKADSARRQKQLQALQQQVRVWRGWGFGSSQRYYCLAHSRG